MSNFSSDFSKALYQRAKREYKCPSVIAGKSRLNPTDFPYWAEVKDGSLLLEQIKANNIWEAKYECVLAWADMKGLRGEKDEQK